MSDLPDLTPLARFRDLGPLRPRLVPPECVPEPARSLLVHDRDMTGTLEQFHRTPIELRVLQSVERDGVVGREVLLMAGQPGEMRPVEFGAIEVELAALPDAMAPWIREGRVPLGGLLKRAAVAFESRPRGYLELRADRVLGELLGTEAGCVLYGRCNVLSCGRRPFARIVEILPRSESSIHSDKI